MSSSSYKPKDQCACIGFLGEHLEKISKVCADIAKKDSTFRYAILNSKFPQYTFILVIFTGPGKEGADLAHKRATWLVKKAFPEFSLCYWIKYAKDVSDQAVGRVEA